MWRITEGENDGSSVFDDDEMRYTEHSETTFGKKEQWSQVCFHTNDGKRN